MSKPINRARSLISGWPRRAASMPAVADSLTAKMPSIPLFFRLRSSGPAASTYLSESSYLRLLIEARAQFLSKSPEAAADWWHGPGGCSQEIALSRGLEAAHDPIVAGGHSPIHSFQHGGVLNHQRTDGDIDHLQGDLRRRRATAVAWRRGGIGRVHFKVHLSD